MWKKITKILGIKQIKENKEFTMKLSGRSGAIVYQSGGYKIEIECEMSGSLENDILLAPMDLSEWSEPKGSEIPHDKQIEILHKLRSWTKEQKLKTDIDLPFNLNVEDDLCAWSGCNENRIKDSAYCNMHYDETLLRK